jgi:hypothetical protein
MIDRESRLREQWANDVPAERIESLVASIRAELAPKRRSFESET